MVLEPRGAVPSSTFFFANILGQVPRTSDANHGAPLATRAVHPRRPAYALPSPRETKHTSHIVVVGQAVVCQQTKIPMGRNALMGKVFLLYTIFPFLHFPWISFSHQTWQ
ncbi:uncharacterized protein TM35_000281840 [Trypanosoma theileri]|uniref:Uncharacterized protein n=1 Tax=Trypanosoma theileri TaxID=67003 RepID=A0A1X0NPM2_9TRYP|nr:uncharacterized protein TM35_000281840 [Trypanosoma theileri]ORC86468.1 hypothetical protein TM35_000281840 [Trypanosoma theileri]